MSNVTRRSLLLAGAGGLALLALGRTTLAQAADKAFRFSSALPVFTEGTTLQEVAAPATPSGYRRLIAGPGYPLLVREELAAMKSARDERVGIASIVQLTDLHLIDAQSPMRFEYLVELDTSGFRPHESLGTHGAASLVKRVNELGAGPVTGREFDCVVSTGDNSDNNESIEMDWFLSVMNGGTIEQNTGSPTEWEGVQNTGKRLYYNPELAVRDDYKAAGFPRIENFFSRVIALHVSEGLKTRWYSVFGNHDNSIGGTIPMEWSMLEDVYVGGTKFTGFVADGSNKALTAAFTGQRPDPSGFDPRIRDAWQVTPDLRRRPFSPQEYIAAHLTDSATGPGPAGHGFTADAAAAGIAYYTFPIARGVTGIALDSTNRAGFTHGSLGDRQFAWLRQTLESGSSRYYNPAGDLVTNRVDDHYFILFSHHTTRSMDNALPDPSNPTEQRHLGPEIVELVQRFPNVLAWVNGHSHSNVVTPHVGRTPRQSFWEINTASHIEFPQQARIIELCDNKDGTLSLFATLIESAAPYQASYSASDQASLASLYREFSANDLHMNPGHAGTPLDHNVELLLVNPLI